MFSQLNEDWVQKKWRPAMGWTYMAICIFDFMVAPIFHGMLQVLILDKNINIVQQWQPLTLQSGAFFHIAMGAVLGISAYGRTKEKTENIKKTKTKDTEEND